MDDLEELVVWYVFGLPESKVKFLTKMEAEVQARLAFPDEPVDRRYQRIYFRTFYREK